MKTNRFLVLAFLVLCSALMCSSLSLAEVGERYPETRIRLLQPAEIEGWSYAKLCYAINEVYARHGVDFKDSEIKRWFQQFSWYRPRQRMTYEAAELEFTEIERQNVKLLGDARGNPVTQGDAPTPSARRNSSARPERVRIVDVPADRKAVTEYGNIEIVFSDGHTEKWTTRGNCLDAHVSLRGAVGWVHFSYVEQYKGYLMGETLEVRLTDGTTKSFLPNSNGGPFIEQWDFAENDAALVIKSRGAHGPACFIRYDLVTGKVTGRVDSYVQRERLPAWARSFADD